MFDNEGYFCCSIDKKSPILTGRQSLLLQLTHTTTSTLVHSVMSNIMKPKQRIKMLNPSLYYAIKLKRSRLSWLYRIDNPLHLLLRLLLQIHFGFFYQISRLLLLLEQLKAMLLHQLKAIYSCSSSQLLWVYLC